MMHFERPDIPETQETDLAYFPDQEFASLKELAEKTQKHKLAVGCVTLFSALALNYAKPQDAHAEETERPVITNVIPATAELPPHLQFLSKRPGFRCMMNISSVLHAAARGYEKALFARHQENNRSEDLIASAK